VVKGGKVTDNQPKRANEPLQKGDWIGERYRILDLIGQGGMSYVYLAEDTRLSGKLWAIKASIRYSADPRGFAAEASMLAGLNHPFLPKIADFYPPDERGISFLVMDYVKGETLQHRYEQGRLTQRQLIGYALQLCDLFDYLHGLTPKPVIYRDLKPGNLMIDEQDNVRLIDFGIARKHSSGEGSDTVLLGTVGFAAPEQFGNGPSDARTDLYGLGAMMYYLLHEGTYYAGEAPSLTRCPQRLGQIITRLLQPDPDERYQSAKALKLELESFLTEALSAEAPSPRPMVHGLRNEPLALSKQLFVVGSLYPGAGSSFVSLALCQTLQAFDISHALVEFPGNAPELFHLLFGDKIAPANLLYLQDLLSDYPGSGKPWVSNGTEWVPLDPEREQPDWAGEHGLRLLQAIKRSVVIVDISSCWQHPGAVQLLEQADGILGVFGSHPGKLSGPGCLANAALLREWSHKGKTVYGIANGDCSFPGRREWLSYLSLDVAAIVPAIAAELVACSQWKGRPDLIDEDSKQNLQQALLPLITKLLPQARKKRTNRILSLWKSGRAEKDNPVL
jgi:serine/threonine-protein kinase